MRWIIRRILLALATIYVVVTITFLLVRLIPGNPIDILLLEYTARGIPREVAKREIAALYAIKLDEPLWKQYVDYMLGLLSGNLGKSMISRVPVSECLIYALPWTVFLISISMIISFSLGVVLGLLMAYRRGGIFDSSLSALASFSSAMPNFILGLLLLYLLALAIPIFPARGTYDIYIKPGFTPGFIVSVLYHAALPMITYIVTSFGGWALAMRSSTVRVLGEDYAVAAEARGLKKRRIAFSYVGRNAVLPLFASLAISIGYMFGGSALVETVFGYSGIGMIMGLSISYRDYPLMQGGFLLITTAVVLSNLLADLLYGKLDPRVKVGE